MKKLHLMDQPADLCHSFFILFLWRNIWIIKKHSNRKKPGKIFQDITAAGCAARMKEKEISIPTDLAGSILFFLLGAVLFFMLPSQVPISENDVINGRVFPKLLFSLMMICSAVLIIQNIIKISKKQPVQVSTFNLLTEVKALMILTILFITYFICRITDLFVLGAIFCSIAFLVYFRCKKRSYYAITIGMAVLIWAAFRFGLNVKF